MERSDPPDARVASKTLDEGVVRQSPARRERHIMQNFTFSYPTKVYFGEGALDDALPKELACAGKTVMLAYGGGSIKKNGIYDAVVEQLEAAGKDVVEFGGIMPNPRTPRFRRVRRLPAKGASTSFWPWGGGSVIDCCKIVSVQAKTDRDVWQMEFVDHEFPAEGIPMGAVVTIFGTGAEMNNGAVITNEETKQKNGMGGSFNRFAVLDPAYTLSAPMKQALSGAFDMLSHSMETYFGKPYDNNLSDRIAIATMRCIIDNTRALLANPNDLGPRSELFWASAMAENGILKIGKATAFQAHMIEHQLGAYTDCNHGFGLAVIHPTMYRNMMAGAPEQFARFATEVWGIDPAGKSEQEVAAAGIDALDRARERRGSRGARAVPFARHGVHRRCLGRFLAHRCGEMHGMPHVRARVPGGLHRHGRQGCRARCASGRGPQRVPGMHPRLSGACHFAVDGRVEPRRALSQRAC